jgi:hypothetical protein
MNPTASSRFEREFLSCIEETACSLAAGIGKLTIGRVPGHEEWSCPYFELHPTNPLASSVSGWAVADDLNLAIGEASEREFIGFGQGGTVLKGRNPREELKAILTTVMNGGFTENLAFNSRGKLLYSEVELVVEGVRVSLGIGPWLGIRWRSHSERSRTYHPYLKD